jgi:hypothetical protein
MIGRWFLILGGLLLCASAVVMASVPAPHHLPTSQSNDLRILQRATHPKGGLPVADLMKWPASFEKNNGQFSDSVKFAARLHGLFVSFLANGLQFDWTSDGREHCGGAISAGRNLVSPSQSEPLFLLFGYHASSPKIFGLKNRFLLRICA